jgi:transposase
MFMLLNKEVTSMTFSMEFREAVARAYDECGSSTEVAQMFNCSSSWVRLLIQRRGLTDSLAPLPLYKPDNNKLDDADLQKLRGLIEDKPDMTLAELTVAMNEDVSLSTVWRATIKLGMTLKKSRRTPPSRTGRT